jgi:hypothetical protein
MRMSPAPKYRARTGNTGVETKGFAGAQESTKAVPLFYATAKRIEGTGMANEADGF